MLAIWNSLNELRSYRQNYLMTDFPMRLCQFEKHHTIRRMVVEQNRISKHQALHIQIVINTEWGAFGDDGSLKFIYTDFDRQVDESKDKPRQFSFEKMIAGVYMGEIVRLVIETLAKEGVLFGGEVEAISRKGCFKTRFISDIVEDLVGEDEKTFQTTNRTLSQLGVRNLYFADCANVAYICSVISARQAFCTNTFDPRAAHLLAAGIATLINRLQRPMVTVGIDGSIYRYHPLFPKLLDDKIAELIDENLRVLKTHAKIITALTKPFQYKLMLSEDGSGIGAAVVAAVAARMREPREEEPPSDKVKIEENENVES
ncbi:unnamed protein product [Cylicostephanus goldi]|uniref:Phosphotransferase n=1 Tax=Cylicostephanus goldi TaxID=71465 RepID=A0A3P6R4H8_CYLGO|nr:unnamed protein product [Cylicostephanus goldi]